MSKDLVVEPAGIDHVAAVEIARPPHNYLDIHLLRALHGTLQELDADPLCRAIVVSAQGRNFCAGRDFSAQRDPEDTSAAVYQTARGLLELETPWVAAIQGGAIGAGLGLALCADYRVADASAYVAANFVNLGLHHGFGTTVTLTRLVGRQRATELLSTGRKVPADDALALGLVDAVAEAGLGSARARELARSLAEQPPLAVAAIRKTMRAGLSEEFAAAVERELTEQASLMRSADFVEATTALKERRPPRFVGA